MRIAGQLPCSMVNGDGVRFVLFLQGCSHGCPGCHNPETWDFDGGYEVDAEWVAYDFNRHAHLLDGITLSGGDPFFQQEECMALLELLPPDTNVWVYTGFRYEEIKDTPLARRADVIVDGPFEAENRCTDSYRGSANQRVIRKGREA